MTSLIWGAGYLVHHGVVSHRREKQRKKNYERWEGLRDDYDEMKKTTLQRPSGEFDEQRSPRSSGQYDREILTLRDAQEANDARTSWRPQEAWESPRNSTPMSRSASALKPQKTGATWDEGLPQPLAVSRRNWDEGGKNWSEGHSGVSSRDSLSAPRNSFDDRRSSTGSARRSTSAESAEERRKPEEVQVVESPYEWWK